MRTRLLLLAALGAGLVLAGPAAPAAAQVGGVPAGLGAVEPSAPSPPAPDLPPAPAPGGARGAPAAGGTPDATIHLDLGDAASPTSQSVVIVLVLTLIAVAPSLLILLTSFTRIVVVLSITRNAIGLPTLPPNQVVVGLALFLSFFVMAPTLGEINEDALQPLLAGEVSQGQAFDAATGPIRAFLAEHTGEAELAMFLDAADAPRPGSIEDVPLPTLVPAFILSELKAAFIIGFIVFVPFLVIDLVTSSVLMSMGMMMLPPVLISLPFKLLLFVMVDGWSLVVRSLLQSFSS